MPSVRLLPSVKGRCVEKIYIKCFVSSHTRYSLYRVFFSLYRVLTLSTITLSSSGVLGCTSVALFASYCDSILRKGRIEKLSDEAIEENLDKVCLQQSLQTYQIPMFIFFSRFETIDCW
jgi:hypothetical protein